MNHPLDVSDTAVPPPPPMSAEPPPSPATALLQQLPQDELGANGRGLLTGAVVVAHLLGGWALLQVDAVQTAIVQAAPIMVSMVAPTEAPKPAPPPQTSKPRQPAPTTPTPLIAAAPAPDPEPAPAPFVAPEPLPQPAPPVLMPAPAPEVLAAPVTPLPAPVPPTPKQIPPSAVRYLLEPQMSVPLMSRRLKESGIVYLHIVVDARGLLKAAEVSKSSGFARLDEQALHDIRSARFAPQTDNGRPIEWQTIAPLAYEVN